MINRLKRTINTKNLVKVIIAGAIVSLVVLSKSTSADAVMTGTVKDSGGNGISGATVCISASEGQNCTQTDDSGVFVLNVISGFNYVDIYGNGGSALSPEGTWSAGHYSATIQDTDTLAFTLKTQVANSLITDQLGSLIENARAQITSSTYQSALDSSVSLTYYGGSNSISTGYTDSNGQVVLHVLDNATAIDGTSNPPVGSSFGGNGGPLAPPRNDDPISNPYSGGVSLKGVLYYPNIAGLTASSFNTPNAPSLTWNAVQGADHYNIYRKFNYTTDLVNAGTNTNLHLAGDMVGSSGTNSFVDNQATAEGVYLYQISAIDANGSILAFTDNSGQGEIALVVDRTNPVLSSPGFSINPVTANTTTTLSVDATDPFLESITSSGVARVEYFIGNDPGIGQATPFLTNARVGDPSAQTFRYSTDISMSSAGTYPITIRAIDNAGNYSTQTVNLVVNPSPIPQLTMLNPVKIWVGLKNSDDVGIKFDLMAEVYKDSTLVTSGEVDSVTAGSSGFNNAKLDTVNFNLFSPVDFPSGSQLKLELYVRNACSGSGHNSGTARLWFNDGAANSQFGATIGTNVSNYYALDNYLLGTSAGSGPKKTIDVAAGAKCSAFKPFGTWSITP